MTLKRHEDARARSGVLGVLARLVLRGLDAELQATLGELDWLLGAEVADLDAVAAAHHQTFFLDAFPYAGAFLDGSAAAGGWSDQVRAHYEPAGFTPVLDELAADHLGIELVFASFVCGAIAEALEDGRTSLAEQLERQLASFYDECLLSWLPALVVALPVGEGTDEATSFWSRVLLETLELVADHRQRLPGPRQGPTLALVPGLLDDE
ncbi:MAG: molecular chaperone TorD family protein, partial [Myxococcales bacterium]|nr:molecular chaperone TorD family protein [Myxococcales bacterium]